MKRFILLALVLFLFSCNKKEKNYRPILELDETKIVSTPYEGKELMETHCYICHSPSAPQNEGRIAPPMVAIKSHYLIGNTTKEDFIGKMTEFVKNPNSDKAIMKSAVTQFNIMPRQFFPEGVIEKIAEYMYDYQVEEPTWFKQHWENSGFVKEKEEWIQTGKKLEMVEKPKTFEEIGLEYALGTKAVLGKNLMMAIQTKGVLHALEFCNVQAIPLTDSMAIRYHATIKRVSDKYRNPNNAANSKEIKYLKQFKSDLVVKKESKPIVIEKENHVNFYYPIPTNTMCLQCHGKQIKPEVRQQILKYYPNDLAIDYDENEIRGIWSITFDKTKE